jgi:anti-sigma-K factor RskA
MTDHTSFKDDVGAFLLGALTDPEREAFERHLAECEECRLEVARLQPAADLLPRSVERMEPPASLKRSLMAVVESEARERPGAPERARPALGERLRGLFSGPMRPAFVAAAVVLAVVVGFSAQRLISDDEGRTVVATVDRSQLPDASGRLQVQGDGEDGAILRVQGMPELEGGQVYQAWIQRDGMVEPEQTFEVGADGGGAVAVPDDVSDAEAVHLTREPRGGSPAPSEDPILTVRL